MNAKCQSTATKELKLKGRPLELYMSLARESTNKFICSSVLRRSHSGLALIIPEIGSSKQGANGVSGQDGGVNTVSSTTSKLQLNNRTTTPENHLKTN